MSGAIIVERGITPARRAELGEDGWPVWKDGAGKRTLRLEAPELIAAKAAPARSP